MSKSKEARPEEFYKSQIRNLKKENDQLRKRVKQLEGYSPKEVSKPKVVELKEGNCPQCGKGSLEQLEFVGRIFDTCNVCSYRSKARRAYKKRR